MSEFKVGQEVVIVQGGANRTIGPTEAVVTKVGRKYVYIEWYAGQSMAFDIETGWEKSNWGYADRLFSREGWADHVRRQEITKRLGEHGFSPVQYRYTQDTSTLAKILEVLEQ